MGMNSRILLHCSASHLGWNPIQIFKHFEVNLADFIETETPQPEESRDEEESNPLMELIRYEPIEDHKKPRGEAAGGSSVSCSGRRFAPRDAAETSSASVKLFC